MNTSLIPIVVLLHLKFLILAISASVIISYMNI